MVTFQEGSIVLAQVPLAANGTASFSTSNLSAGDHTITAVYASDTVFASSSDSEMQTVASPIPVAAQALNLSTRMRVQSGDSVGIGGFIITGTAPKHVLIRAIGPSLTDLGVADPLPDPVLELHGPETFVTVTNDDWRDDATQEALIQASGIPPRAILSQPSTRHLAPGSYTAVVSGKGNAAGIGLVEVYDLNPEVSSKLANVSTRAFVGTGDNIVIAGVTLGRNSGNDRLAVRGLGPTLNQAGIANALSDPILELRNVNGTLLVANNDWQDDTSQADALTAAGVAPTHELEAAIIATLPPGTYTALLAGLGSGTGRWPGRNLRPRAVVPSRQRGSPPLLRSLRITEGQDVDGAVFSQVDSMNVQLELAHRRQIINRKSSL